MRPIVTDRVAWSVGLSVTLVSPAKTTTDRDAVRTLVGPGNHALDGVHIPHGKRQFSGGKGRPIVKHRDTLRSPVQKRLNRSRCRLGYGLGWASGIMCYMRFTAAKGGCHGNQFLAFCGL